MMYGNLLDSQVGHAQDFIKKGQFRCLSHGHSYSKSNYIDCAYLFSAAKFFKTDSADTELVSWQTQLISFSAILQETE